MTAKSLRQLFDAMHHGKHVFGDFLNLPMEGQYEQVGWRDRTIYKPSKTLIALHSFLNNFVFDYLSTNTDVSFAYRKGKTIRDALEIHAQSRTFYQTDIRKFFDSIGAEMVRSAIERATPPVSDLSNYLGRIVELCTIDGRLPIGFSTSPNLSNACLKDFDDRLAAQCAEQGWLYSRYADDIVISTPTSSGLDGAQDRIQAALHGTLGPAFQLNQHKSRLLRVGRKVKILGMVILPNGRITIDREVRQVIETQMHFYTNDRERLKEIYGGDIETGLQRLSGYVSYLHSADALYLDKLRRKFGNTLVDSFLHRSAQ